MRKFYSFCLALFFSVLIVGNLEAATYYIDGSNGSDSNPGTITSPWTTISKANSILKAGDTVYIRGGTYEEKIAPANSGTTDNYIKYAAYEDEIVTITAVYDGVDINGRSWIDIDGIRIVEVTHYWVSARDSSATHNIIQNCYMKNAAKWAGMYFGSGSDYNIIRGNTLIGKTGPDDVLLFKSCDYTLVEDNSIEGGFHVAVSFADGGYKNIVRNNTIINKWHTGVAFYGGNQSWGLCEGNTIMDCGENHENIPPPDGVEVCAAPSNPGGDFRCKDRNKLRVNHAGLQLGASNCIIRNNLFINNGSMSFNSYGTRSSIKNRIYSNTFYKNHRGINTTSTHDIYGNIIKNNIFHDHVQYELYFTVVSGLSDDNTYAHNSFLSANIRYKSSIGIIATVQDDYPSEWQHNLGVDPKFTDEAKRDLTLLPNSPMIDAGDFLTQTSSSGSGKTITVEDASYFCDGWGIIEGDMIQLEGEKMTARITIVDYSKNTITVDTDLSWGADVGINLVYSGTAPDIGAYEYPGFGENNIMSPQKLQTIM
jgi:hypothetical protein